MTTITSSPSSRSPRIRHSKRFFMPLTWLNGLGSTKMATLEGLTTLLPPRETRGSAVLLVQSTRRAAGLLRPGGTPWAIRGQLVRERRIIQGYTEKSNSLDARARELQRPSFS